MAITPAQPYPENDPFWGAGRGLLRRLGEGGPANAVGFLLEVVGDTLKPTWLERRDVAVRARFDTGWEETTLLGVLRALTRWDRNLIELQAPSRAILQCGVAHEFDSDGLGARLSMVDFRGVWGSTMARHLAPGVSDPLSWKALLKSGFGGASTRRKIALEAMHNSGPQPPARARALQEMSVPYVVVNTLTLSRSREFDNLTRDKTDLRDAALIGDLVAELRFTELQLDQGPWAELRLLAEALDDRHVDRRAALVEQRSLLELGWPELLQLCPDITGSHLQAMLRLDLTPAEIGALSRPRFTTRLRREHDPAMRFSGVMAKRLWEAARAGKPGDELPAVMVRVHQAALRLRATDVAMAAIEAKMKAAFERTGLGWMRGQIKGLGDVTLITVLGLSGDPRRFDDSGCICKLAGVNPTERSSGMKSTPSGIHRRGRSTLRAVAFQGAVLLSKHNPEFKARYETLINRPHRPLRKKQALVALENKLLRTIWAMAVSGQHYSSAVATGEERPVHPRAA